MGRGARGGERERERREEKRREREESARGAVANTRKSSKAKEGGGRCPQTQPTLATHLHLPHPPYRTSYLVLGEEAPLALVSLCLVGLVWLGFVCSLHLLSTTIEVCGNKGCGLPRPRL